jgi:hypothetical protein
VPILPARRVTHAAPQRPSTVLEIRIAPIRRARLPVPLSRAQLPLCDAY